MSESLALSPCRGRPVFLGCPLVRAAAGTLPVNRHGQGQFHGDVNQAGLDCCAFDVDADS